MLIDSASDENGANSSIKMTRHKSNEALVCLSRTRKESMRSKRVVDEINDMKMKLGGKVILRKTGKTKVDSEPTTKIVNSAKRKRVEDVIVMGQGDDRLPGTSKTMTDVAMVPPILMAVLRSASYETTLTGATLEVDLPMVVRVPSGILNYHA